MPLPSMSSVDETMLHTVSPMRRFLCSRNDQLMSQLVPNTLGHNAMAPPVATPPEELIEE